MFDKERPTVLTSMVKGYHRYTILYNFLSCDCTKFWIAEFQCYLWNVKMKLEKDNDYQSKVNFTGSCFIALAAEVLFKIFGLQFCLKNGQLFFNKTF